MFTSLVSWLLVACVPGLLMLATLGLERLEKDLAQDTVTATDVDDFLEHAEAVDVHTLAREGMPEALEYLHRRQALQPAHDTRDAPPADPPSTGRHAKPEFATDSGGRHESGMRTHSHVNPQFRGTGHVNRV